MGEAVSVELLLFPSIRGGHSDFTRKFPPLLLPLLIVRKFKLLTLQSFPRELSRIRPFSKLVLDFGSAF